MESKQTFFKFRALNQDDMDHMVASAITGFCATITGHPVDSVKVRMQTAPQNQESVLRTMYTIIKQEGVMPFYRGVLPPSIVKSFTTMVFFTTNNYLKEHVQSSKRNHYITHKQPVPSTIVLSLSETCAIAAFCGLLLTPFISVGELIKIQLQNDKNLGTRPRLYNNMFDCTSTIIKYKQLHRGMIATSTRLVPGWGVYLLVYDAWNRHYDDKAVLGSNETLSSFSVTARVLVGGSLAGWLSWTASYPFDYIKTQIQAHPVCKWNYTHTKRSVAHAPRFRDVVAITFQRYGMRGFYRGLVACLIRSFPVNMTNFWVYETVLQLRQNKAHQHSKH
eukprot:232740_1